jgi:hypothetical protein
MEGKHELTVAKIIILLFLKKIYKKLDLKLTLTFRIKLVEVTE